LQDVEQLLALNSSGIDYIPAQDDGKGGVSYQYKNVERRTKKFLAVTYKAPHNSAV
jgi:hypothetical protein